MSRRVPPATHSGQPPPASFDLIDELSCYYDTPGEPNNVHLEVLVPGPVDFLTLRQAVAGALAAAPRARGRMAPGRAFRCRYTWEFPPAPDVDPLSRATWSDEGELAVVRDRFLASSPPLRTSPLVRLLLAPGPGATCVILKAHHAAMDGMSSLELLRDIAARYRAITGDAERDWRASRLPTGPDVLPGPDAPPNTEAPSGADLALGGDALPSPLTQDPAPSARPGSESLAAVAPMSVSPPMPGLPPRAPAVSRVRVRYPVARVAPERDRRESRDGYGLRLLPVPPISRPIGATVNDMLVAALIATISRWNAAHRRRPRTIRITVPVNVRGPSLRCVAGNHSRTAKVTADPRTAAGDLPLLLAVVTTQTSAIKRVRTECGSAGFWERAPGWCPVALKRLAVRFALRAVGRIVCDTSMLTNLGNVADPPWSGYRGAVRMAFSSSAHMPRGMSVGVLTADGQLQLSFRYRHALFDAAAAERFTAIYAAVLAELTGGAVFGKHSVRPAWRGEAKEEEPVVLPEALLKLLVCPVDKDCLMYFSDENLLYNPRLRRAYRIEGGIPVMLAERAEPVQEREHERLIGRARDGAADLSALGRVSAVRAASEEPRK